VLVLTLLICLDVGVSVHSVAHAQPSPTTTSYTAHLFGFAAGLLLGVLVLRHFALKTWNRAIWWLALGLFALLMSFGLVWNVIMITRDFTRVLPATTTTELI